MEIIACVVSKLVLALCFDINVLLLLLVLLDYN